MKYCILKFRYIEISICTKTLHVFLFYFKIVPSARRFSTCTYMLLLHAKCMVNLCFVYIAKNHCRIATSPASSVGRA